MLTKQEREAIAERFKNHDEKYIVDFYRCLFGTNLPDGVSLEKSRRNTINRLIDLCDTSNMVELPLDKDGKVIHVGDIVYYGSTIYMVKKLYIKVTNGKFNFLTINSVSQFMLNQMTLLAKSQ